MSKDKQDLIKKRDPFLIPRDPNLVNNPSDTDYSKLQQHPEKIITITHGRPDYYTDGEEEPAPEESVPTELAPQREYTFSFQDAGSRKYDSGLQALQSQLYRIGGGKYFPGNGEDQGGDGYYGENTAKAIQAFAADHGIESDGKQITDEIRKLIIDEARSGSL